MTGAEPAEPRHRASRRAVTVALLRTALSAGLLVTGYYLAPLEGQLDSLGWLWFVLALVLFVVVVVRQLRAIVVSDQPRLRAVEGLGVALPLLFVVFALTYVSLDRAAPGSFTEALDRTDALYFTVTVFATVGFGDITPVTATARILTTVQMVVAIVALGVIARIFVAAVDVAVRRRDNPPS
ncbi:two pore domain potassium channel family protein [Saccharomonospora piscinae]|uniref:potassium channel family protein n=1 Tax=Saccharomonospora piscinae TaxID=687388 RepID=UPI0011058476|nr:potassium channel family protein [Saccharomonospora piscinae]TLW91846.1 two pore domain potassium channel family protein [Saccharomonospora piscinae]